MSRPGAACAGRTDLDWTPDVEAVHVPAPMAELCAACPLTAACRTEALTARLGGYWGGTTSAQRARYRARGDFGPQQSRHPGKPGSESRYRRLGCRCDECRADHAAARRRERQRTAA